MDRDNADFQKVYVEVEEFIKLHGKRAIKVHLPIGQKHNFKGVVDIIGMNAYLGDGKTTGDIPAELIEEAEKAHFTMVEAAAEGEDELMEKYLENGSLTDAEMVRGLEDVVYAGQFVPVFCAAGAREIGILALLNDIIDLIPSPAQGPKRVAKGKERRRINAIRYWSIGRVCVEDHCRPVSASRRSTSRKASSATCSTASRSSRAGSTNVEFLPAQQRVTADWYRGTADAVFQNLDILRRHAPKHVLILAGDHVYKMDYSKLLADHAAQNADMTIACMELPIDEARAFGVMKIDADGRVTDFAEKPQNPEPIPGRPDVALGSMGIYVFNAPFLFEQLIRDADDSASTHNFGTDIIPQLIRRGYRVVSHRFADSCVNMTEGRPYWRDVGTVET